MMRTFLVLALVPLARADTAANTQNWAAQVETDKSHITSKIHSLESSAGGLNLLEKDDTKIRGFASKAQQAAAQAYQARIQDAQNDYQTSQAALKALSPTANKTNAENKVRETRRNLNKLE